MLVRRWVCRVKPPAKYEDARSLALPPLGRASYWKLTRRLPTTALKPV